MTRGGGAAEEAIKALRVLPALSLGDLWLQPPFVPAHNLLGAERWLGDTFSFPSLKPAEEPITVDYGMSRREVTIMKSLGVGWGIRPLSHADTRSWGRRARLSSDHEVLVILIVKIQFLGLQLYMDPAYRSAPRGSQWFSSRACVIISPPKVTLLLIKAEPLPPYCLGCSSCTEINSVDCTTSH